MAPLMHSISSLPGSHMGHIPGRWLSKYTSGLHVTQGPVETTVTAEPKELQAHVS